MFNVYIIYTLRISVFLSAMLSFFSTAEIPSYFLLLKNHTFTPNELIIPANTKVKIIIENVDDTAEEFDSFDLNRERMIFAKRKSTIFVGPLPPGKYEYFGEYHPNLAKGYITVSKDKL